MKSTLYTILLLIPFYSYSGEWSQIIDTSFADGISIHFFEINNGIEFDYEKNETYFLFSHSLCVYDGIDYKYYSAENDSVLSKMSFYKMIFDKMIFDKENTLWIMSSRGLVKFKNDSFYVFNKENSGLINHQLSGLTYNKLNNELWFTNWSSQIYKYDMESFKYYDCFELDLPMPNLSLSKIAADAEGNIWYASMYVDSIKKDQGCIVKFKNEIAETYPLKQFGLDSLTQIATIDLQYDNTLYFGTSNGHIIYFDNEWKTIDFSYLIPNKFRINKILKFNEDLLFFNTYYLDFEQTKIISRLFKYNLKTLAVEELLYPVEYRKLDNCLYSSNMTKSKDNKLYIGANYDGIMIYDPFYVGVEEKKVGFQTYPNPAANILNIQSEVIFDKLDIFDIIGNKVLTTELNSSTNNIEININSLQSGIYFVELTKGNLSAKKSIIVSK